MGKEAQAEVTVSTVHLKKNRTRNLLFYYAVCNVSRLQYVLKL